MSYRTLPDIDAKIIQAVWKIGAQQGISKVTARRVAAECGVSDYTVFNHFKNGNRGFLDAAAHYFFRTRISEIVRFAVSGAPMTVIWDEIIDAFLAEPNGSLYFFGYGRSFGFAACSDRLTEENLLLIAKTLFSTASAGSDKEYLLLLSHFFFAAMHYAEALLRGQLPNDKETRTVIRRLVCRSIARY